ILGLVISILSIPPFIFPKKYAVMFVARFLMGMASGVTWSVGQSMLTDRCDPSQFGFAFGVLTGMSNVGLAVGPLMGGLLYDRCGFNAPFYLLAGLFGLDLVLRVFLAETARIKRRDSIHDDIESENLESGANKDSRVEGDLEAATE